MVHAHVYGSCSFFFSFFFFAPFWFERDGKKCTFLCGNVYVDRKSVV